LAKSLDVKAAPSDDLKQCPEAYELIAQPCSEEHTENSGHHPQQHWSRTPSTRAASIPSQHRHSQDTSVQEDAQSDFSSREDWTGHRHPNAEEPALGSPAYGSLNHLTNGSLVGGIDPAIGYPQTVELDTDSSRINRVQFFGNPTRSHTTSTGTSGPRTDDPESAFHEGRVVGRREKAKGGQTWKRRWDDTSCATKWVVAGSISVAFVTIVVVALLLGFSKSQKMVRGALLGGFTVVPLCVALAMFAGGHDTVKIIIAMTSMVVYGLFVTSQLDVLLSF
jgi:hypothetical protein